MQYNSASFLNNLEKIQNQEYTRAKDEDKIKCNSDFLKALKKLKVPTEIVEDNDESTWLTNYTIIKIIISFLKRES
ncbi:hypothetical protein Halha_1301 [Halobacteroides halobius DSM 5150]|uniref:Uncharacterized protein n=1 Tax=Halobacteroides halobius (strain ATCC 35273 / DSM 5150 / MD-1) TaxID=748449 RepID=L0K897_HALHC|nr:hypothetical protein [Halobacteroides halobius]AGB41246.1 hypothetical protein Halha_1301 [Halobacteroides halobius DSM 5150]